MKKWLSLILSALTMPMMFGGCASEPADTRPLLDGATLVAFGDSLTAQSTWPMEVAEQLNMHLVNAGIGANTTAHGAERFERDVLAHEPDYVILCFGSNDFHRKNKFTPQVALDDYRDNLVSFVEAIRKAGAVPILMTPPFISENASGGPTLYPEKSVNAALDKYVEAMREIADEHDVILVDIHAVCDDAYTVDTMLCADGVHLSDQGNRVYTEAICETMREHFRSDADAARVTRPTAPQAKDGAWTESLVPFTLDAWNIIYPGTAEGKENDDGSISFWNTNNQWPEVHYSPALDNTIAAPVKGTTLTVDIDLKAGSNLLLFFNGPTPTHPYDTSYVSLTPYLKAADPRIKTAGDDLQAGQHINVTLPLSDIVPSGYIRDDGTVLFSGVKLFVTGVAYTPVTIHELSITTVG